MDPTLKQTAEGCEVAFEAFGVGAVVRGSQPELAEPIRAALPPGARERGPRVGDAELAIELEAGGDYRVVVAGRALVRTPKLSEAVDLVRSELLEHVAIRPSEYLFVRAGAVAMGGRAIVLVDEREAANRSLVTALVREGATYYSDRYMPIDRYGRVHPFPLDREISEERAYSPAPVALIVALAQAQGRPLALREGSQQDAVLALLQHACGADERPEFTLRMARTAVENALTLLGERDDPGQAAAALIERLAHAAHKAPAQRQEPPPRLRFVTLVLELEGQLAELARMLEGVGVEASLVNGEEVRPALANGFALTFSVQLEIPRRQIPRALGTMDRGGWRRTRDSNEPRYFRGGVVVRIRPRPEVLARGRRAGRERAAKDRFGFLEPKAKIGEDNSKGPPTPMPFDPGGPVRSGPLGAALRLAAEALAGYQTLRLRTLEFEFHGLPVQYGPGVHAFEMETASLPDAVLARLPKEEGLRVVEVGTGTGAVALTVATARPDIQVLAVDISLRALGWAARNRRRLGIRNVRLAQGSLLAPLPRPWRGSVAAIAINPPMALPAAAPELGGARDWPVGTATGPGADGLGLVRAVARDARDALAPGGILHLHLIGHQGPWIAPYLDQLGYETEIPDDAKDRYVVDIPARWPGTSPASRTAS